MNYLTLVIIVIFPWAWYLISRTKRIGSWFTSGQPANLIITYVLAMLICMSLAPSYGNEILAVGVALIIGIIEWVIIILLKKKWG